MWTTASSIRKRGIGTAEYSHGHEYKEGRDRRYRNLSTSLSDVTGLVTITFSLLESEGIKYTECFHLRTSLWVTARTRPDQGLHAS